MSAVTRPILPSWHAPRTSRWTNDVACWIGYPSPADVYDRHAAWAAVDLPAPAELRPPVDDGRLVEFQLIDLDGNLLRIGAPSAATA